MIPVVSCDLAALRADFCRLTGLGTSAYRITPRSPWPSELFALFALARDRGVTGWIEGGTYHGQAAEVLARAMPEATVQTVEIDRATAAVARERLAHFGGRVVVIEGDGRQLVSELADRAPGPVGVFLDGPKSFDAMILAHHLISVRPSVAFVGMHDMAQSVPGRAVPARAALEELARHEPHLWAFWATDDPEYVAWAHDLDDGLREQHVTESSRSGWRPFEHFAEGEPTLSMLSYGPTVSFLLRAIP